MNTDGSVYACLIVDDLPLTAAYWARLQQQAFGYEPVQTGWGYKWWELAPAGLLSLSETEAFADLLEDFGVRGKCTLLPYPAGLGRIDVSVRGYDDAELQALVAVVRERIARRMDITPEVLTHTMALDPQTQALLPYPETPWLTSLAAAGDVEALTEYVGAAFRVLSNVGIRPRGLTIGGMEDVGNLCPGESLLRGDHRIPLCEALLRVEREFDASVRTSFLYTGSPPLSSESANRRAPEQLYEDEDGRRVFEIHTHTGDPLSPFLHGPPSDPSGPVDEMISADLSGGWLIDDAESGRVVSIPVHSATIKAMNTLSGLSALREALTRFKRRYGDQIVWLTTSELCDRLGAAEPARRPHAV